MSAQGVRLIPRDSIAAGLALWISAAGSVWMPCTVAAQTESADSRFGSTDVCA